MGIPSIGQNFTISGYNSVKCSGNPDQDAQAFASANNMSLEQAKQVLQGQFGAPQSPQASGASSVNGMSIFSMSDSSSTQNSFGVQNSSTTQNQSNIPPEAHQLISLGIPIEVIQQGDDAIMNFAQENNIQLPEKAGRNLSFEC